MAAAQALRLARIDAQQAGSLLAGLHTLDPRGIATPADIRRMADEGHCFSLTADNGAQAVYVLMVRNGQAWIEAAAAHGAVDFTRDGLAVIERQAERLDSVAFQTARRGLVRKAMKRGYRVTGWILKKDLR